MKTTTKSNIRKFASGIIGVVLAIFATQHVAVEIVQPSIQRSADKAACKLFYKNTPVNEIDAVDPECAILLTSGR